LLAIRVSSDKQGLDGDSPAGVVPGDETARGLHLLKPQSAPVDDGSHCRDTAIPPDHEPDEESEQGEKEQAENCERPRKKDKLQGEGKKNQSQHNDGDGDRNELLVDIARADLERLWWQKGRDARGGHISSVGRSPRPR